MSEVQLNGLKGNYGFYQKENSKPVVEEETTKQTLDKSNLHQASAESVMNALSLIGQQNLVHVASAKPAAVDPAKYLSQERIASIENSMKTFEAGVEKYASAFKAEFGLSDGAAMELAAQTLLLE